MSRLTLLLASLTLAGCAGSSPWAGGSAQTVESEVTPAVATAPVEGEAADQPRYSWQRQEQGTAPAAEEAKKDAPEREGYARIQAIRPEHALIALAIKPKPEDGTTLQLSKETEAILIKVVRSDDTTTIADILPIQDPAKLRKFLDSLEPGDEIQCGVPVDVPVTE